MKRNQVSKHFNVVTLSSYNLLSYLAIYIVIISIFMTFRFASATASYFCIYSDQFCATTYLFAIHIARVRSCLEQLSWFKWKVNPYLAILITVTFRLTGLMIVIYTEETLKSLNKAHMIDLFLKMQEHTNNIITSLAEEIKELNSSFKRLESDVLVFKKNKWCIDESSCSFWKTVLKNVQYSRKECLETMDIPSS